jgi:hypothetical protein
MQEPPQRTLAPDANYAQKARGGQRAMQNLCQSKESNLARQARGDVGVEGSRLSTASFRRVEGEG